MRAPLTENRSRIARVMDATLSGEANALPLDNNMAF